MPRSLSVLLSLVVSALLAALAGAQGSAAEYERSRALFGRLRGTVPGQRLDVTWLGDGSLWFADERPDGTRFRVASAEDGVRDAFDHAALARALAAELGREVDPERLPVARLVPVASDSGVHGGARRADGADGAKGAESSTPSATTSSGRSEAFAAVDLRLSEGSGGWRRWIPDGQGGGELGDTPAEALAALRTPLEPARRGRRSRGGGETAELVVVNATSEPLALVWLDTGGRPRSYGTIAPGERRAQNTYARHAWRLERGDGSALGEVVVEAGGTEVFVDGAAGEAGAERERARRRTDGDGTTDATDAKDAKDATDATDADGGDGGDGGDDATGAGGERRRGRQGDAPRALATLRFRDQQAWLVPRDGSDERRLTDDGTAEEPYAGPVHVAPDGRAAIVFRERDHAPRQVTVVESSPDDQVQPKVHVFDYDKPGDPRDARRPALVDLVSGAVTLVDDALFRDAWSVGRFHWSADSSRCFFLYNARGHQTLRVLAIDAATGAVRTVVEETSPTFVDYSSKTELHHLEATDELLWASERSGWNHLYLVDRASGEMCALTSGEWVVRDVAEVDEEGRTALLRVSGVYPEQDPYYVHQARVSLDDGTLTLLTEGDGTHELEWAPGGALFVDTWSRVDHPPVHELRRADGTLVAELARCDGTAWRAAHPHPPERFVAPGRDGVTPIQGVIWRPSDFDPARRYPVVEAIYAGPHGQHVPKRFAEAHAPQRLAELGFVVVQIDGMGTNWRSKAFHDVAWKDLADAGFPDRKAWLQAAAAEHPEMDLERVGIYGGSAGGQNAMRAVLDHADLYDAAVADCGCHDNRMDKIWWNEQWLGWPVDECYVASSNVEDAAKLGGALLLMVGELDRNVDPASTMQVVDALIRADKDFELVVFPGAGHGAGGGAYGWRRTCDFFVRELHEVEPRWTDTPTPTVRRQRNAAGAAGAAR